jgi:hypothetical protein
VLSHGVRHLVEGGARVGLVREECKPKGVHGGSVEDASHDPVSAA